VSDHVSFNLQYLEAFVDLQMCETWPLTLRKDNKLECLAIWCWRESYNEQLHYLANIIMMSELRRMKCERHTVCME
jgi:hypothetical protein